jgi:hypothetical protein
MSIPLPREDVREEHQIPPRAKKMKWLEKKKHEKQHHLSYLREKKLLGKKMMPRSTILCSIF